jgi:hypothetical protein
MLSSKEANEWMQAHAARLESEFFSLTTTLFAATTGPFVNSLQRDGLAIRAFQETPPSFL